MAIGQKDKNKKQILLSWIKMEDEKIIKNPLIFLDLIVKAKQEI